MNYIEVISGNITYPFPCIQTKFQIGGPYKDLFVTVWEHPGAQKYTQRIELKRSDDLKGYVGPLI